MASMTQRKLIKFGKGIAITLPKAWTDYYRLKAGDSVLVITNGKLSVSPIKKEEGSVKSLAAATEPSGNNEEVNPRG